MALAAATQNVSHLNSNMLPCIRRSMLGHIIDVRGPVLSVATTLTGRFRECVCPASLRYKPFRREFTCITKTAVAAAASIFFTANVGFLASAISAVLGKGAPYLPTEERKVDMIFNDLLSERIPNVAHCQPTVVDLGSGDGRVILAAARRGYRAIGVEFNPLLVLLSRVRAWWDESIVGGWKMGGQASFLCANMWKVNFAHLDADVFFVYGLTPIMQKIGQKLYEEAREDVIVVSNVFEMDSTKWTKISSRDDIHVYTVRSGD